MINLPAAEYVKIPHLNKFWYTAAMIEERGDKYLTCVDQWFEYFKLPQSVILSRDTSSLQAENQWQISTRLSGESSRTGTGC